MQSGDLVVKAVAALVETARPGGGRPAQQFRLDFFARRQAGGQLQQAEGAAGIAVGSGDQQLGGLRRQPRPYFPRPSFGDAAQFVRSQGMKDIHLQPRQQGIDDLEGGVFRGRAEQQQRTVLHEGQQRVLLCLVEAVDLVQKQHRIAAARIAAGTGFRYRLADLAHPGLHRRQGKKFRTAGAGQQAGQRRLARARRPPKNQRMQACAGGGLL